MAKFGPMAIRDSLASMLGTLDRFFTPLALSEIEVFVSVEVVAVVADSGVIAVGPDV